MSYKTEQEEFWAGDFGDQYIGRNDSDELLASNLSFFSRALQSICKAGSVMEFGANIGMNLKALKLLFPGQLQYAVEINKTACQQLEAVIGSGNVTHGSIFDVDTARQVELSMIKGVLIHINPDMLPDVYRKLYEVSTRYILIAEYYSPAQVEISYRGHVGKLFKRDFCGDILDQYPDLRLLDYGFVYRRDPAFPQDDITWFLLEKGV